MFSFLLEMYKKFRLESNLGWFYTFYDEGLVLNRLLFLF